MTEGFENSWVEPVDQGEMLFVCLLVTLEYVPEYFFALTLCSKTRTES